MTPEEMAAQGFVTPSANLPAVPQINEYSVQIAKIQADAQLAVTNAGLQAQAAMQMARHVPHVAQTFQPYLANVNWGAVTSIDLTIESVSNPDGSGSVTHNGRITIDPVGLAQEYNKLLKDAVAPVQAKKNGIPWRKLLVP